MANKTDQYALHKHGTDPQNLIPPITRAAVYNSTFWNTTCFGLTLADLVHVAVRLRYIAGFSPTAQRPSPFLCLLLKLLQLAPDLEHISVFLQQKDFKYPAVLAAFYIRLVENPVIVYKSLEPSLSDYRRVVIARDDDIDPPTFSTEPDESEASHTSTSSPFSLCSVDVVIDSLLRSNELFGIPFPRLPPRPLLVETNQLQRRTSSLQL